MFLIAHSGHVYSCLMFFYYVPGGQIRHLLLQRQIKFFITLLNWTQKLMANTETEDFTLFHSAPPPKYQFLFLSKLFQLPRIVKDVRHVDTVHGRIFHVF